jgi:hypothetical protein
MYSQNIDANSGKLSSIIKIISMSFVARKERSAFDNRISQAVPPIIA